MARPAAAVPGKGAPPAQAQADRELTVMTRNLYLGAELGPIFDAETGAELLQATTLTYAAALASEFPGRAELLADEIVDHAPHLVGLQEVSLWRTGPPGPDPSNLAAAGPAGPFFNVRLTDRDVILARTDLATSRLKVQTSDAGLFQTALPLDILGEPLPVILVGDFNSPAPDRETYLTLLGGGFTDVWSVAHPGDEGLTCCHAADLRNETAEEELETRIDLILTRGGIGVRDATVIGVDPDHRTPDGLWPSDHAGVVATLTIPVR